MSAGVAERLGGGLQQVTGLRLGMAGYSSNIMEYLVNDSSTCHIRAHYSTLLIAILRDALKKELKN
jgi:hypothetical protein